MEADLSFGPWLQRRRKRLDLTQAELAQRIGYARVTIHKIETDQLRASRQMAEKLADALAIDSTEREAFVRFARDTARAGPPAALPPRSDHVPVSGSSRRRHNLPIRPTCFIGREREVQGGCELLRGDVRLLTLTGVGGIGKTRLALEIAAALVETFPDGVWFVDLAPLAEPDLVLPTVATVLGLREHPSQPLHTTLVAALRSQHLLLVLDNCEHLVDTCARLSEEIVRTAPDVRILVTSREALRIAGEVGRPVPPLALPPRGSDLTVVELQQHEAVRLFIERARAVRPSFAVTGQNAVTLAKICWRLDGIPLALELAAARVGVLSVGQIDTRLDDRFRLLTGGSRTALPRQQTLWATVDWSYALLAAPERRLFDRLSVFAGGWTLEAAEAVCAGDGSWITGRRSQEQGVAIRHEPAPPITHDPSPLTTDDVLDLVTRLVDQSLVVVEDEPPDAPSTEPAPPDRQPFDKRGAGSPSLGGVRYRLLETLRQYGRERLVTRGEAALVHDRHAAYFLGLAEEAEPDMEWHSGPDRFAQVSAELDNFRAALLWYHDGGHTEDGLRLAAALGRVWSRLRTLE